MSVGEKAARSSPAAHPSPGRRVAFEILLHLERNRHTHSDELLQSEKVSSLSGQDRNFCTALVMGALRWQLALDERIATLLSRKGKLDLPVRIALRMAAFQLLQMDRVPPHAVISDSVELAKRSGHHFAARMVNAVLRRLVEDTGDELTAVSAHPAWLCSRWRERFGGEATAAICEYDQQPPPVYARVPALAHKSAGVKHDPDFEPGNFLITARRLTDMSSDSNWRVQDEGSQLIAEALAAGLSKPMSILDCCAAPGGKTAILAERRPRAHIVACDISETRLRSMERRLEAIPSVRNRIEYRHGDVCEMTFDATFDLILCDAPCSGTGTLARNPEIKLRLRESDLLRQQERQVAILRAGLRNLAPDGMLVYSTCSLEPEENEQVVQSAMDGLSGVRLLPMDQHLHAMLANMVLHAQGFKSLLHDGLRGAFLQTVPGVFACDGFFAALLTRESTTARQ